MDAGAHTGYKGLWMHALNACASTRAVQLHRGRRTIGAHVVSFTETEQTTLSGSCHSLHSGVQRAWASTQCGAGLA